ncbi:hypothetical protein [Pannonibacter phragmitetus]|uniref:hypothetical protein n=1 Tax=Pannonibacter phragmitetus TaxID=121719 RepID=UPI003D2F2234
MKDSGFGAGWHAGSALIGVLSGLALGAMFGMWFGPDVIKVPEACEGSEVSCFLYTWQTLLAGIFATVAAGVGAVLLWFQIKDQRSQFTMALMRRQISGRSRILHAISDVHEYLTCVFKFLMSEDHTSRPEPPRGSIDVIIEESSYFDANTFGALRKVIEWSQIFEARVNNYLGGDGSMSSSDVLIMILDYFHRLDLLFNFARFEVEEALYRDPNFDDYWGLVHTKFNYSSLDRRGREAKIIEDAINKLHKRLSAVG